MLRRYLVALVGAPVGFAAVVAVHHFGLDFMPDYRLAAGPESHGGRGQAWGAKR